MKKNFVKKLLAGCLAMFLFFSDASGVLAANMNASEETQTDVTLSDELETVSIEPKEETVAASKMLQANSALEENRGPIYKAYFGLPSVLTPSAAVNPSSAWTGDRITGFGPISWRILNPENGLVFADEILMWNETLYEYNGTADWDGVSKINTALNNYLTSDERLSDLEKTAVSDIRLITKDEVLNSAYGFYSTEASDNTRVLKLRDSSYGYRVATDDGLTWVTDEGGIYTTNYTAEDDEIVEELADNVAYYTGYAPALELDSSKIFMTLYSEIYGPDIQTDISEEINREWRLLLRSSDEGFNAELPNKASYGGKFKVNITNLPTSGSYDQISMVLSDGENIIIYDTGYNPDTYNNSYGISAPAIGEFEFYIKDVAPGNYQIKVFAENTTDSYVSNIVEGTLEIQSTAASNLSITQEYGEITLHWEITNKRTEQPQTYTYCNIYRADSENGTYTLVAKDVECDNSNPYYYWKDSEINVADGSAANGTYYYKIATLSDLGGTETSVSDKITNENVYYGFEGDDNYIGAYLADKDGNKVTSLVLHEGEAAKLQIAYVKKDGTVEYFNMDKFGGASWFLFDKYCTTKDLYEKEPVANEKIGIYPYEILTETDGTIVIPENRVYIQAEKGGIGTYYLTTRIFYRTDPIQASWHWQIPVSVIAAVDGEEYEQVSSVAIAGTKEEAEQKLREFMIARDNTSRVVVPSEVDVDSDSIFDIYAEREGSKPYEGDYLYYHVGYTDQTSFFWSTFGSETIEFNGMNYDTYWSTTPFITTAEQEKEVDDKINALVHTKGGALYKYAHGENVSDAEKIQAIYRWITTNVNTEVPGDRTTPLYHTVYHTLFGAHGSYPGSGTCGAFAVLFTRLSREMGIASKAIMGTDAAAHAYNVVQLGHKWYFIDTNTKRNLSDATNFKRAQEQSHYLDQRFIDNYLSKIDGNTYNVVSEGTAVVTDSLNTEQKAFTDLGQAADYVLEKAALTKNKDVEYTITIKGGKMAFPTEGLGFFDKNDDFYGNRVTLDLGGNTLTVRDGFAGGAYSGVALIGAKYVHNGWISVGDDASLRLYAGPNCDTLYENLDIVYASTTSGADLTPMLSVLAAEGSKAVLDGSVNIEKFYAISASGDTEINTDLSATYVELGSDSNTEALTKVNGTVTANTMLTVWGGTIDVDSLISNKKTIFHNPDKTDLIIAEKLNLAGTTNWEGSNSASAMELALERKFASAEDTVPMSQAVVNISGTIMNKNAANETAPLFHIVAKDYVGEEIQINKAFASGTTIGTVSAKGFNGAVISSTNLNSYFAVETADDGKSFADIENNRLSVVSLSVKVQGPSGKIKEFASFKRAVEGLNTIDNGAKGSYKFIFTEDIALTANISIPTFVTQLVMSAADDTKVALNFAGYGLSTSAKVIFDTPQLKLVSSAENGGKFVTSNTLTVENGTGITAENVMISSGELHNYGTIVCDNLIQNAKSKTFLYTGSRLIVENSAVLHTTQLMYGGAAENPAVYKMPKATVAFNSSFKCADNGLALSYGILSSTDEEDGNLYDDFIDLAGQQVLFASNISKFPVEMIDMKQQSVTPRYTMLLQKGTNIVAVIDWITLKDDLGSEKKFTTWKDTLEFINSRSDASMKYVVEISEDLDLEEAFTMPSKAKEIVFRGVGQEAINLTYVGDLKLTTHTTFENMNLSAQKYNSTQKVYEVYKSVLNLAGKNLTLINTSAEFASIAGTVASNLRIVGADNEVTVDKTLKNLASVEISGVTLKLGTAMKLTDAVVSGVKNVTLENASMIVPNGTVAFTGTFTMKNAVLDANSKINLVDIVSNSEMNRILYGGNAANNILTITGTITSDNGKDIGLTSDYKVVGEDDAAAVWIRQNAIDIKQKSLADDVDHQDVLLINAKKVAPTWFVVGSKYNAETKKRTDITALTYKNNDKIYYGLKEDAPVKLFTCDNSFVNEFVWGDYGTVAEAIAEIERIADKTANYSIYLSEDMDESSIPKTITTPVYAESLKIYSDANSPKNLYFGQKMTVKSDLILQNITLAPTSATSTISLDKYKLNMIGTTVAPDKKLGSITGSGVNGNSMLILENYDEEFTISGSMTNVGTLVLNDSNLAVEGTVNIGNIKAFAEAVLAGTAALTRKNGVVTAIKPSITIANKADGMLEIVLLEKKTSADKNVFYDVIDFEAEEMKNLFENTGIALVNAKNVPSMIFAVSAKNVKDTNPYVTTKAAGYVVLQKCENVGIQMSYEESDNSISSSIFKTFADAVTEINNLRVKRQYHIELRENSAEISLKNPVAITMPNKNYASGLIITGTDSMVRFYHTSNISLTVPTTLSGINFEKVVKAGSVYVPIEEQIDENASLYPSAVTISAGGNALTIDGKVYFNTPVVLNGGKKGILKVTDKGQLATITNGKTVSNDTDEQLICGNVTGFAEVVVNTNQIFHIMEYGVFAKGKVKYTAGNFDVTALTNYGKVLISGDNTAGKIKITNANLNEGSLYSCGTLNIANMTLEGTVSVQAEKDFDITGQLVSSTNNATFYSRQKTEKNPVPYLNINANVTLENPEHKIKVGVYPAITAENQEQLRELEGAPSAKAQLLTVKTATAEMFVPVEANVGMRGAYSPDNPTGYSLMKNGKSIYVYYGDQISVALCNGNANNLNEAEVIAYYPSFKDAVSAIDSIKNKTAEYTIVLLKDLNSATKPAAVTLPTQAANVTVTSLANNVYNIFFTGNMTLKASTEFVNVCFNPMNTKKQGTTFNVAAGNFNLSLRDIKLGDIFGMKLNNITGSTKSMITLATENLEIAGSITNLKELVVEKPVTVKGSMKATTISVGNGSMDKPNEIGINGTFTTDKLLLNGCTAIRAASTLTIKDIVNNSNEGAMENIIHYCKNNKSVSNLNVKGFITGNNEKALIFNLDTDMKKEDFVLAMDPKEIKFMLNDQKKLAVMEKAALSDVEFQLNGSDVFLDGEIVKANKGVYVIDTSSKAGDNGVLLEIKREGVLSTTYCLDFVQAVNEINNIADESNDYLIRVGIHNTNMSDTNLTDGNKISAITMPAVNKAASVTITSNEEETMTYTGHISYAGDLSLVNLVLNPIADSNITITKDKNSGSLYMENITTFADKVWVNGNAESVGFIGKITGTKNVTNVTVKNCDLRVKGAISNVNNLILDGTELVTINNVTANKVIVKNETHWDTIGKVTISNLDVSQAKPGYYLASKQTARTLLPMFIINGEVILDESYTPSVWKVITAASKTNSFEYVDTYKGVSLVIAVKEDADKFVAYPFSESNIGSNSEGITKDNWISYKTTKNAVVNGM